MERKRADDEYKLLFQQHLTQLINQKYGSTFSAEHNKQLVQFIDALSAKEKQTLWDDLSYRMQKNRNALYKFYHNTYKPFVMDKFPEEQLQEFAATAQQMAVLIIKENPRVTEKDICSLGISRSRYSLNLAQYESQYHTASAYHKMRNAILEVYRRWLDSSKDPRMLNNISLKFTGVSIDALMIKLPGACSYDGYSSKEQRRENLSQTVRFQIYKALPDDSPPVLQQDVFEVNIVYNSALERNVTDDSITWLRSVPKYEENVENQDFVFSLKQPPNVSFSLRNTAEYSTSQHIVLVASQDDDS